MAANKVELAYTPNYSLWLNRDEAQFKLLRYFAPDSTDHASHCEHAGLVRSCVIGRKRNAQDQPARLRKARKCCLPQHKSDLDALSSRLVRGEATNAVSVSVVIPLYNKASWVTSAIQSILNQSIPAAEIIVVDDGSSDGGGILVREQFTNVIVTSQVNSGEASARNRGVEIATSEWVAFMDADDLGFLTTSRNSPT